MLGFALWELMRHPDVMAKVRKEADELLNEDKRAANPLISLDEVNNMQYTMQVLNEVLRLYSVAASTPRIIPSDREVKLCGYKMPAGHYVSVSVSGQGRHEELWDRPLVFEPDRFGPGGKRPSHPCAYLPFGAGPRICIGKRFAQLEARIILATLLHHLEFEITNPILPPGSNIAVIQATTLRPVPYDVRIRARYPFDSSSSTTTANNKVDTIA
jgi:cytochrome P450